MWTSFTISLLGLWLLAAPETFNFQKPVLIYSDWICGALLFVLGWINRTQKKWTPWAILSIGIWLQAAPLLFWASDPASYLNDTLVGVWVIALSMVIVPLPGSTFESMRSVPPGWSYNPSSWPQRMPVLFFAFVCWMISRYLAAFELGFIEIVWDPFFGDGTYRVLTSTVSKSFPVADAGLGAFAYTIEFLAACQGDTARWRTSPWLVIIFGILVIPVSLVSTVLIILQPLIVHAWCTLCLTTALCMLIPIAFAVDEIVAVFQYLRHSKEKPFFELLFKGGECPQATDDQRTPALDQPLSSILKASAWGVTFPINLIACGALGVYLMFNPYIFHLQGILQDLDSVLGALVIVCAAISFGEMARKVRYLILLFAMILFVVSFIETSGAALASHAITAGALALLSFRKGPIREKFY